MAVEVASRELLRAENSRSAAARTRNLHHRGRADSRRVRSFRNGLLEQDINCVRCLAGPLASGQSPATHRQSLHPSSMLTPLLFPRAADRRTFRMASLVHSSRAARTEPVYG